MIYQIKPSNQIAASECISRVGSRPAKILLPSEVDSIDQNEVLNVFLHLFTRQAREKITALISNLNLK